MKNEAEPYTETVTFIARLHAIIAHLPSVSAIGVRSICLLTRTRRAIFEHQTRNVARTAAGFYASIPGCLGSIPKA